MLHLNKKNICTGIDLVGIAGIGVYCLCSAIFYSNFAELHIQLSFLDFPIFVGEILMFFMVVLFTIKTFLKGQFRQYYLLWLGYLLFIMVYVLMGYYIWGALALRNAALFYYVLFALLSFNFYQRHYFNNKIFMFSLLILFISLLAFKLVSCYFWLSFMALSIFIILRMFPKQWWLLIPVALLTHVDVIFLSIRAHMVGIFCALIFVLAIGTFYFVAVSIKQRLGIFIGMIIALLIIGGANLDRNALQSITNVKMLFQSFHKYDHFVKTHQHEYNDNVVPYKLYHPNSQPTIVPQKRISKSTQSTSSTISNNVALNVNYQQELIIQTETLKEEVEIRNLDVARNNILFRLFIWRDMWEHLYMNKLIFGIGFGEPQRSKSLEILTWGDIEWLRDGWVAPHNSFLHIVYRAGILGVGLILFYIAVIVYLTKIFVQFKNFGGIILLSILIYWSMVAQFSVTLELPYNAIFFWSMLGVIAAYAKDQRKLKA